MQNNFSLIASPLKLMPGGGWVSAQERFHLPPASAPRQGTPSGVSAVPAPAGLHSNTQFSTQNEFLPPNPLKLKGKVGWGRR